MAVLELAACEDNKYEELYKPLHNFSKLMKRSGFNMGQRLDRNTNNEEVHNENTYLSN